MIFRVFNYRAKQTLASPTSVDYVFSHLSSQRQFSSQLNYYYQISIDAKRYFLNHGHCASSHDALLTTILLVLISPSTGKCIIPSCLPPRISHYCNVVYVLINTFHPKINPNCCPKKCFGMMNSIAENMADVLHIFFCCIWLKINQNHEFTPSLYRKCLRLYAPITANLGFTFLANVIRRISFAKLFPAKFNELQQKINHFVQKIGFSCENIASILHKILLNKVPYLKIIYRIKEIPSIFAKMQRLNTDFHTLHDLVAFSIIVNSVANCYQTLGIIHSGFNIFFAKFYDYIACAKSNNYQAIHTTVIFPHDIKIEIQIKTNEMNFQSLYGLSCHNTYKCNLVDSRNVVNKYVYFFDSSSTIQKIIVNSSIVDFAFAKFSSRAIFLTHCLVNGNEQHLNYRIKNLDCVELFFSKAVQLSLDWHNYCFLKETKKNINLLLKKFNLVPSVEGQLAYKSIANILTTKAKSCCVKLAKTAQEEHNIVQFINYHSSSYQVNVGHFTLNDNNTAIFFYLSYSCEEKLRLFNAILEEKYVILDIILEEDKKIFIN